MNAAALVVGPREGQGAILFELAHALGLMPVMQYRGVAEAERLAEHSPLTFFLFAEVDDVRRLAEPAQAIRFSAGRRVRFSPLIYFTAGPSMETLKACISMGFDDVIAGPLRPGQVGPRLQRQVETELVYYQTSTYFGPDRRSRLDDGEDDRERRGGGQFRRLEIVRHIATGVNVLRDIRHRPPPVASHDMVLI